MRTTIQKWTGRAIAVALIIAASVASAKLIPDDLFDNTKIELDSNGTSDRLMVWIDPQSVDGAGDEPILTVSCDVLSSFTGITHAGI